MPPPLKGGICKKLDGTYYLINLLILNLVTYKFTRLGIGRALDKK